MSRRPYVRPVSKTTWYMRNGRYRLYMLREMTCLLVGFYSFLTIYALSALAAGPGAWAGFIASQQNTAMIVVHAIALFYFMFYQTFAWFELAPKAMPVQLGEKKLPGRDHRHRPLPGLGSAQRLDLLACGSVLMAIAKKAVVWGLFAAGGTVSSFIFPALIGLFLLIALGMTPGGLQYESLHAFATGWTGKAILFLVLFLSLWHAAHRLRVVFHDLGVRRDRLVANVVYLLATIGTMLAAYTLYSIG